MFLDSAFSEVAPHSSDKPIVSTSSEPGLACFFSRDHDIGRTMAVDPGRLHSFQPFIFFRDLGPFPGWLRGGADQNSRGWEWVALRSMLCTI